MKTIITHPRFDYLADNIARRNPSEIRKGWADFARFPDRTPNLSFPHVKEEIEHQDVTYIGDFSQSEELFENYSAIFNLTKNTANKIRIIMPYFPMGTSERVEKKWKTETAHAFAHMISHLPSGRREKNSVHIFDIHALVEQSLFDIDRTNAELHTTTSLLDIADDEMIVFPDDGAAKRFREYFPNVPDSRRITCGKERSGEDRIITIKEWNPIWANVIIVDDLIQTGGTIRQAAKMLRKKWALSVRAFAPHGVFPSYSYLSLAQDLDELIVTDSIPNNIDRSSSVTNMRVLSIVPLIERIMRVS